MGGIASLVGTYFIGPRAGRFGINGEVNKDFRENNGNLVVLGTFLLWFGWWVWLHKLVPRLDRDILQA